MVPCESAWLLPKTKRKKAMETAALCKPIQRSADLLRIPGTWVLTGLGKLLAVLGSFPQFRTASTTASHTSFWRFLECQSIEATLTQNGHLTHHEIPSVASLRPGGHFPRIGWPVSPEYAVYVDPSRGLAAASDGRLFDGRDDRLDPREIAGVGGWPHGIAAGAADDGRVGCSSPGPGHRSGT